MKQKRIQIPGNIINAVTGKLAVAFISAFSTFTISFFTWVFEPVKKVIELPGRFNKVEMQVAELSTTYYNGFVSTSSSDSTLRSNVNILGEQLDRTYQQVKIVEIQIDAIGEEFPILHKRFNDIERSVTSINRKINYEPKIMVTPIN